LEKPTRPVPDKLIVAVRHVEDISWLDVKLGDIDHLVYQHLDPEAVHNVDFNNGREASAYVSYIIENYDKLPNMLIFMHGHEQSWHHKQKVEVMQNMNWDIVRQLGFVNLRYLEIPQPDGWDHQWLPHGLEGDWLHPKAKNFTDQKLFDKPHGVVHGHADAEMRFSKLMAQDWHVFEPELGPVPELVHSPLGAEFVVTKERILLRPLSFYQKVFKYMKHWAGGEDLDPIWRDPGYVLEPLWSFIFGEPPVSHGVPKCVMTNCPWKPRSEIQANVDTQ
jgi:hypothetical protein